MVRELSQQATEVIEELVRVAKLPAGALVVVGCSTSEVLGSHPGTHSSPEVAEELFEAIYAALSAKGIYLAAQCCEHLNRAVVLEAEAAAGLERVNVLPQPKAGGAFATAAYRHFHHPVVVEEVRADAGLDIGAVLIGMNLKRVAVPLRLTRQKIGQAILIAARTRPRFIGGARAVYDEGLL